MSELSLLRYDILKAVPHCFTTRTGGVSTGGQYSLNLSFSRDASKESVLENYRRVAQAVSVDFHGMTHVPQVHGDSVLTVTEREVGIGISRTHPEEILSHGYDAMITNVRGAVLCTLHADCVPVLLYDEEHRAVGAVHSGWRGTVLKIAEKTVRKMQICYGTDPARLRAVIGPSIGMAHFETDRDVYDAMHASFGALTEDSGLVKKSGSKFHIFVSGFVYETLRSAGLRPEHIVVDPRCTFENEALFFSHRRDHGNTGAMSAVISPGGSE